MSPTTAVLALDQLHRLLRLVGRRHLHDNTLLDADGRLRLIFPTPDWDDFVQLSCREIRLYGAENFQVSRRLHAMLENLLGRYCLRRGVLPSSASWTCWILPLTGFTSLRTTWHSRGGLTYRDWEARCHS